MRQEGRILYAPSWPWEAGSQPPWAVDVTSADSGITLRFRLVLIARDLSTNMPLSLRYRAVLEGEEPIILEIPYEQR